MQKLQRGATAVKLKGSRKSNGNCFQNNNVLTFDAPLFFKKIKQKKKVHHLLKLKKKLTKES